MALNIGLMTRGRYGEFGVLGLQSCLQYRRYNFEELDQIRKAFELLRTKLLTGKLRFDGNFNGSTEFNFTGLNILYLSMSESPEHEQVHSRTRAGIPAVVERAKFVKLDL
jgi:hypothetical protein